MPYHLFPDDAPLGHRHTTFEADEKETVAILSASKTLADVGLSTMAERLIMWGEPLTHVRIVDGWLSE